MRLGLLLVAMLGNLAPLHAHEVFVDRVLLVQFGDVGEHLDAYDPARVLGAEVWTGDGAIQEATLLPIGEASVMVQSPHADPAAVLVRWDGGYRIQIDGAWKRATREEAEAAPARQHHLTTSLRLFRWSPALAEPRGKGVEVVVEGDPAAASESLSVRVFIDGAPAAGAAVRASTLAEAGTTDVEGRIAIPRGEPGLLFIRAQQTVADGTVERVHRRTLVVDIPRL